MAATILSKLRDKNELPANSAGNSQQLHQRPAAGPNLSQQDELATSSADPAQNELWDAGQQEQLIITQPDVPFSPERVLPAASASASDPLQQVTTSVSQLAVAQDMYHSDLQASHHSTATTASAAETAQSQTAARVPAYLHHASSVSSNEGDFWTARLAARSFRSRAEAPAAEPGPSPPLRSTNADDSMDAAVPMVPMVHIVPMIPLLDGEHISADTFSSVQVPQDWWTTPADVQARADKAQALVAAGAPFEEVLLALTGDNSSIWDAAGGSSMDDEGAGLSRGRNGDAESRSSDDGDADLTCADGAPSFNGAPIELMRSEYRSERDELAELLSSFTAADAGSDEIDQCLASALGSLHLSATLEL